MTGAALLRFARLVPALALLAGFPLVHPPAYAREATATAVIDWDYRPRPRMAVDGILWRCAEEDCTASIVDTPAAAQRACSRLARRYGRVVRFETPAGALSEEALARCNRSRR
ncbi:hypothetical protein [Sphingosinicella sp. CPCC 101087]|uniref:CC_3452 family protein n=1 Tax=Sphingosinicella sp. CPCC 101087 TaxID=2497754 RepID=UPI00101CDF59|nr:hypothetical protein [Sphingosinicella sp. CPCC 101087]